MEADTPLCRGRRRHTKAMKLCLKHAFKPTWTRCKEAMVCAIHPYPFLCENLP